MNIEFPKQSNSYLSAKSFQDQLLTLTWKGWEKKANEDRPAKGKMPASTWKQNLKYVLRYSYPEFALDEAGEKRVNADGQPFRNSNYDPDYPQGYTVVYHFEEGVFESGSLPLFKAFCMVRPAVGDVLVIGKTGLDKETKWQVKKVTKDHSHVVRTDQDVPEIDWNAPEYSADPNPNDPPF